MFKPGYIFSEVVTGFITAKQGGGCIITLHQFIKPDLLIIDQMFENLNKALKYSELISIFNALVEQNILKPPITSDSGNTTWETTSNEATVSGLLMLFERLDLEIDEADIMDLREESSKSFHPIPKNPNFTEDDVQCGKCRGFGCSVCDQNGFLPNGHINAQCCERKECFRTIRPGNEAIYCSNACANLDAKTE